MLMCNRVRGQTLESAGKGDNCHQDNSQRQPQKYMSRSRTDSNSFRKWDDIGNTHRRALINQQLLRNVKEFLWINNYFGM